MAVARSTTASRAASRRSTSLLIRGSGHLCLGQGRETQHGLPLIPPPRQFFSSSGTFPPFSASFFMTCFWSHMFIVAESFMSPL